MTGPLYATGELAAKVTGAPALLIILVILLLLVVGAFVVVRAIVRKGREKL